MLLLLINLATKFIFFSPACCCSCFRQRLLAAYPGDCLLSIGCWTDRRHDWEKWQTNSRFQGQRRPWANIKDGLAMVMVFWFRMRC